MGHIAPCKYKVLTTERRAVETKHRSAQQVNKNCRFLGITTRTCALIGILEGYILVQELIRSNPMIPVAAHLIPLQIGRLKLDQHNSWITGERIVPQGRHFARTKECEHLKRLAAQQHTVEDGSIDKAVEFEGEMGEEKQIREPDQDPTHHPANPRRWKNRIQQDEETNGAELRTVGVATVLREVIGNGGFQGRGSRHRWRTWAWKNAGDLDSIKRRIVASGVHGPTQWGCDGCNPGSTRMTQYSSGSILCEGVQTLGNEKREAIEIIIFGRVWQFERELAYTPGV
ncbi:hypothetical protein C8R44DRAFT_746933 [Mycena epipterygia]|nr:hypothetical protein C8R44DRAFT_746933 [Mycena epipterygia]